MWKGSGYDYSKLIVTPRFHPPMKNHLLDIVRAEWVYSERATRLWLAAFKPLGIITNNQCFKDIINVLSHEVLHGVIHSITTSDRIDNDKINDHWPFLNGFDPGYKKDYKYAKASAKGYYIE